MKIVFRVDASIYIGTGHVSRCLTLAETLAIDGADCKFVCRDLPGNLIDVIRSRGFITHVLPAASGTAAVADRLAHAEWLCATWQDDATQSCALMEHIAPDWLVVDHYALDKRWEDDVVPFGCRLLVIDDLADRMHVCDILLDQNLGHGSDDYVGLVPAWCTLLIGSRFALLRPEFAQWRLISLARRASPRLEHLLITMGGVDKDNATGAALSTLRAFQPQLPANFRISVVLGGNAPWLEHIRQQAADLPWSVKVLVDATDMAELMAQADLAIGAAGGTAWERCCLGLPTLLVILADNQRSGAKALADVGAGVLVGTVADIPINLPRALNRLSSSESLSTMTVAASAIIDGRGCGKVAEAMMFYQAQA